MKLNEEARLLRLGHLRTLRQHAQDAQIVVTLDDFIADTETELVALKPDGMRKIMLH